MSRAAEKIKAVVKEPYTYTNNQPKNQPSITLIPFTVEPYGYGYALYRPARSPTEKEEKTWVGVV